MFQKPKILYHGSSQKVDGSLQPILKQDSPDHVHTRASVFATERINTAALFMFLFKDHIASIGLEQGIAYICIWGTAEEFAPHDKGGYIYILPSDSFEKIGKEYEWQSFEPVQPIEVKKFKSVIDGMIECGVQVYFINDDKIFDQIRDNKDDRISILKKLKSEN
ncbi:MAG: hypothetical protein Q8Q89_02570 [bacterium]|nr:hypothetical protein [bacterium]